LPLDNVVFYELAYSFRTSPGDVETWLIERVVPGGTSYRLNFKGTRKEAEAEVARLNALACAKAE
jgi:hypothetical protein